MKKRRPAKKSKPTSKTGGMLIRFPMPGGGHLTYDTDQLEQMPKKRLAALRKFLHAPPATEKTAYSKTSPRRRKTFADGSQLIESASGYEIFEGIPKPKKARRKAAHKQPPSPSIARALVGTGGLLPSPAPGVDRWRIGAAVCHHRTGQYQVEQSRKSRRWHLCVECGNC